MVQGKHENKKWNPFALRKHIFEKHPQPLFGFLGIQELRLELLSLILGKMVRDLWADQHN